MDPPPLARPSAAIVPLLVLLAGIALLHGVGAFGLSRGVDLPGSPGNAFFDIDTGRVIADWTTWAQSDRARTHPLYKFIALVGIPLNDVLFRGGNPTGAVRLIGIAAMLGQVAMVVAMMGRLGACRTRQALAGAALGVSACGFFLSAIPDTAVVAGLFSVAPFLLLYARRGEAVTWGESAAWVALALGAFGVTISQIVFVLVALSFRVWWLRGDARAAHALRMAVGIVVVAAGTAYLLMKLQGAVFGGTTRLYKLDDTIRKEYKFMETEQLAREPHARAGRLLLNAAVHNFAAPPPALEEWSPPRSPRRFLSLTFVDAPPLAWRGWQWPMLLSHLALLAIVLARWRPRAELAPVYIALAGQALLHLVYGREFLMYAPHWHGLLIVALLAAPGAIPRWLVAWAWLQIAAMAASNLAMLHESFRTYREDFPATRAVELIRAGDLAVGAAAADN